MFQNITLKVNYGTKIASHNQGLSLWAKWHLKVPIFLSPSLMPMITLSII